MQVDGHVHLEKGPYSVEWVNEFIKYALDRNIEEIYFLEHTHLFQECQSLYTEMAEYNAYQGSWFEKKKKEMRSISEYISFIESIKKETFPVKLKFGLEVCYSPEHEKDIEKIKSLYSFDFLAGSIHFIDGWAFSHLKQRWDKKDYDLKKLYTRYYEIMYKLVQSKLFSGLSHPNSLQCFGAYPEGDFSKEYDNIACALKANAMYVEESSGLAINYDDKELGMNKEMLKYMQLHDVSIITASDAHYPKDVGKLIPEMNVLLSKETKRM